MKFFSALIAFLFVSSAAIGSTGLVIHAAEFWGRQIPPNRQQEASLRYFERLVPLHFARRCRYESAHHPSERDGGSISIFYSTLDDLLSSAEQVVDQLQQPISVLNVHAHGAPGLTGFPATETVLQSDACKGWRALAFGDDEESYEKYYDAVPMSVVESTRKRAALPLSDPTRGCSTGLPEWRSEVPQFPDFKAAFTADTQIHFLSCSVGLGEAGKEFTEGIAELLLPPGQNDGS